MSAPDTETERSQRNWRQWRIPAKIYGRVRTSTVAFGICFVLTALLYGQVGAAISARDAVPVQGPVAVESDAPTSYTPPQSSESRYPTTTPSPTPTDTTEVEPSGSSEQSGEQASTTTAPPTTTTAPFGVPIPPAIQSLIPTQPAPTSAR